MGKEHLIGHGVQHIVPPEARNERQGFGAKNRGSKSDGSKKAFTRFSGNQFDDRKSSGKKPTPANKAKAEGGTSGSGKSSDKGNNAGKGKTGWSQKKKPFSAKGTGGAGQKQGKRPARAK